MSVTRLLLASWLACAALFACLSVRTFGFLDERAGLAMPVAADLVRSTLVCVPPALVPCDEVVPYSLVRKTWIELAWEGTLRRKPHPPRPPKPKEEPKTVSELLEVLLIQVDSDGPAGSLAQVRYLDTDLILGAPLADDHLLRPGDRLGWPHEHVRVTSILLDGVRFAFDDAERGVEIVRPKSFPSRVRIEPPAGD